MRAVNIYFIVVIDWTAFIIRWKLCFGTPLFKGHHYPGDTKFGPRRKSLHSGDSSLSNHKVTDHKLKRVDIFKCTLITIMEAFKLNQSMTRLAKRWIQWAASAIERLDRNIVLYEIEKFTKTDSQLPIDLDPWASLITLRRS